MVRSNKTKADELEAKVENEVQHKSFTALLGFLAVAVVLLGYGLFQWTGQDETKVVSQSISSRPVVQKAKFVKPQFESGCRRAVDFVQINRLLAEVKDLETFSEVVKALEFKDGEIIYPELETEGAMVYVEKLKTLFETIKILNSQDLLGCQDVLVRAKLHAAAREAQKEALVLLSDSSLTGD